MPLGESIDALKGLKNKGLIRYWGVGNLSSGQVLNYIREGELIPHQVHFNPAHKEGLKILQAGRQGKRCINCVISPFEQGLLVSPSLLEKGLGKKDVRNRNPYFKDARLKKRLSAFFNACLQKGISPVSAVIKWILKHREVDVIIPGPRTPTQLIEILDGIRDEREVLSEVGDFL